jgi:hypothetical protein
MCKHSQGVAHRVLQSASRLFDRASQKPRGVARGLDGRGMLFSLRASPGRRFKVTSCSGMRRRSMRTAVHSGRSSWPP